MTDPRLTPATDTVALDNLRGVLDRAAYVPGEPKRVAVPVTDLCRAPQGKRDRQVIFGADVTLIEEREGWSFVQADIDGYCGWIRSDALIDDMPNITHRVSAPATHIYPEPNLKTHEIFGLTLGSRLTVVGESGAFSELAGGGWVPTCHLSRSEAPDPGAVALSLMGTPYLWGGNSRNGIDCSGLAQASLLACGIPCPGDSDMQEKAFPEVEGGYQRGDLLFWPGHVAIALDGQTMIHATAYGMTVRVEYIDTAIARINTAGDGPFLGARRPDRDKKMLFP